MDQGDAAVLAAAITGGVGIVAAVCAFAAGKAQANGVVRGVKLQLSGQREDALWQAEADAYAELIIQFNKARMQIGNVVALFSATRQAATRMSPVFGTREDALKELMDLIKTSAYLENIFRLRVPVDAVDEAAAVRSALMGVMDAIQPWCVARSNSDQATTALEASVEAAMAEYRSQLDRFASETQQRLSRSRQH